MFRLTISPGWGLPHPFLFGVIMLRSLVILAVCCILFVQLFQYIFPRHDYVINVYFGVPGSGKTTFAAWLTKWANHEAAPIRAARWFCNGPYITSCIRLLTVIQYQWYIFAHQRELIWRIGLGYRLSAWVWSVSMLPVRFSRWLLEDTQMFKRRIDVYSNVPITGSYVLDAKKDLGNCMIQNGKVIIDEAGVEFNNRNFKSFSKEAIYFFKYHRHYQLSLDVFSQSFEDMDITIRRLARSFFIVRKSLIPNFIVIRKIIRRVGIDQQTHQIMDQYDFGIPIVDSQWVYCPPLWQLFNTYSKKELPDKEWEQW